MNINEKHWRVLLDPQDGEKSIIIEKLMAELSISRLAATALLNRGYKTAEEAESFIRNETVLLHDPFLLPDMERAAELILSAVEKKDKITVYGDYDADGVTATCILYSYLVSKGADAEYYIPDRKTEGYGMNLGSVRRIYDSGSRLIVTVDNGITAVDEIKLARELGMTVVVTDHHSPHEVLPDADALVDPWLEVSKYPFNELAGVGVAFKTICAVETLISEKTGEDIREAITRLCRTYTDLVAIGTVADVMPIRDENRLLCAMGLYLLKNNPSPGVDALIYAASLGDTVSASNPEYYAARPRETNKRKINTGYISYVLAPRINAAGRVTHAYDALSLFLSTDSKEAMTRAIRLCEINTKRKSLENTISEELIAEIESLGEIKHKIIVMASDTWKNGVVGIVASRLIDKYSLPVVLISYEDSIIDDTPSPDDCGKGSCRSIPGFDIHAALDECSDLFVRYGGHELAAGVTIQRRNFEEFKERISQYADRVYDEEKTRVTIDIDCEASLSEINTETINELFEFEPYGTGNTQPIFATYNARIKDLRALSQGKYAKLTIEKDSTPASAVCFVCSYDSLPVYYGERADVCYNLELNEFKGFVSPQLTLKDIRPSAEYLRELYESLSLVSRFVMGEDVSFGGDFTPERKDFTAVYSYLREVKKKGFESLSLRRAAAEIRASGYSYFEAWHVLLISLIFNELGLAKVARVNEDILSLSVPELSEKRDLESSHILKRYRRIKT